MMRDILTGGACNVNGEQSAQVNQNPFNRFMGNIFTGQAQNADRMQGFQGVDGPQGDLMQKALMERGGMMASMNKEFDQLSAEFDQKMNMNVMMEQNFLGQQALMNQQQMQMDQAFMHQQKMMEHEAMVRDQMMQQHFKQQQDQQIQQMIAMEKSMSEQFSEAKMQQEAEDLAREIMMERAMDETELKLMENEAEQEIIKQRSGELWSKMAEDNSPRMKNSKFLHFMKQMQTGELTIKDNELVQGVPTSQIPADVDAMFAKAWETATEEQKQFDVMPDGGDQYDLEKFWQDKIAEYEKERANEDEFTSKLDHDYKEVLKYMEETGDYDELSNAWQKASDMEEQNLYKNASDYYGFQENNPFLAHENPLHLALEFISQGRPTDAILALEAQIQKNPQANSTANSWRILGRLHQENDQDQRAVACFLNALKKDDKNPDTFLALGVSCTNILDEVKAMNFLKHWYMISDMQKTAPIDPMIVVENKEYHDYTLEEIKATNMRMLDAFTHARNLNPGNPDLHFSLAVLQYISRDYEGSVQSFRAALQHDPNNYSLWNKLGATLAQLGRSDEAIDAYSKALELKPNYVRVWVNLGIAYAYKQDYAEAARLYLNALSFNPEAKHLWSYLQTCFMCLFAKISGQNPKAFANEFEIMNLGELPQPEYNYQEATKKYLISEGEIQSWLSDFKKDQI